MTESVGVSFSVRPEDRAPVGWDPLQHVSEHSGSGAVRGPRGRPEAAKAGTELSGAALSQGVVFSR